MIHKNRTLLARIFQVQILNPSFKKLYFRAALQCIISENAKNTGHCSEFPLHKKFKLVLEQNVTKQTYL